MTIREITDGQAGLPVPNSTRSYWHKEPSKILTAHRTTADLPKQADLVIIGSGMTGAFAAHFLKEDAVASKESVVMLEAREACWGATGRNGGHCQPFWFKDVEVAKFELETYSYISNLIDKEGIECSWRSMPGVHPQVSAAAAYETALSVSRFRREHPDLHDMLAYIPSPDIVKLAASDAEPDNIEVRLLQANPAWAKGMTLESLHIPNAEAALIQRYAASMWPYKLVCWVLERLLATTLPEAFNLQTTTPVTKLSKSAEVQGSWVVETPRGRIIARKVLLATNAYTSRLLPKFSNLIVPVRAQMTALLPPKPRITLDHPYDFWGSMLDSHGVLSKRDEYLVQRPLPHGELIVGGARDRAKGKAVGVWRDDEVEPQVSQFLRSELQSVLDLTCQDNSLGSPNEGMKDIDVQRDLEATWEWTGIMGFSIDNYPWVGAVPESLDGGEGLWMSSGYTGHGMPRATLCGRGVARMLLGQDDHGLPGVFLTSEARIQEAYKCGPVGSSSYEKSLAEDHMFTPY